MRASASCADQRLFQESGSVFADLIGTPCAERAGCCTSPALLLSLGDS